LKRFEILVGQLSVVNGPLLATAMATDNGPLTSDKPTTDT